MQALGDRITTPILTSRRAENQASWANRQNWFLAFYFGSEDSRLWVPRRTKSGEPDQVLRIINFGHRLARPALRILALAYLIGAVFFGFLIAFFIGLR